MKNIKTELKCEDIVFGSYDCYSPTQFGFDADMCLVCEVNELNTDGITTIGCCCGHGKLEPYIQVEPKYIKKMEELGYEQIPVYENGNGQWCFKPKTTIPSLEAPDGRRNKVIKVESLNE